MEAEPPKALNLEQKTNILTQMNRGIAPEAISLHLKLDLPDILDITKESLLLEKTEALLLEDLRQACVALEADKIRRKARALYEKVGTQSVFQGARADFRASDEWLEQFVKKNELILTSGVAVQSKRSLRKRQRSMWHFEFEDVGGNLDEIGIYEHLKKRPKSTPPGKNNERVSERIDNSRVANSGECTHNSLESRCNSSKDVDRTKPMEAAESHNATKSSSNDNSKEKSEKLGRNSRLSRFNYSESSDTDFKTNSARRRAKSVSQGKYPRKRGRPRLHSDTESESDEIVSIMRSDVPNRPNRQRSKSTLNLKIDLQVPDILEKLGLRPTETPTANALKEAEKSKELQRFLQAQRKSLEVQKSAPTEKQETSAVTKPQEGFLRIPKLKTPDKPRTDKEEILKRMLDIEKRIQTLPEEEKRDVLEKMKKTIDTTTEQTTNKQQCDKRQSGDKEVTSLPSVDKRPELSENSSTQNEPTAVHLKWGQHHYNMTKTIPSLLQEERYVDVTLYCENRKFQCHKLILSASSLFFDDMLSGITPMQHPVLFMRGISCETLNSLIHYMYAGEVIVEQDKLEEVLEVAETLKIKGLHRKIQVNDTSQSGDSKKTKESESSKQNTRVRNESVNSSNEVNETSTKRQTKNLEASKQKSAPTSTNTSTKSQDVPKKSVVDIRNAITLSSLLAGSPAAVSTPSKSGVSSPSVASNRSAVPLKSSVAIDNKSAAVKTPMLPSPSIATNKNSARGAQSTSIALNNKSTAVKSPMVPSPSIATNKNSARGAQSVAHVVNKSRSSTGVDKNATLTNVDRSRSLVEAHRSSTGYTNKTGASGSSAATSRAPVQPRSSTGAAGSVHTASARQESDVREVEESAVFTRNVEIVAIQSKIQDFEVKPIPAVVENLMAFSVPCLEDYGHLASKAANRHMLHLAEDGAMEAEIECEEEIECDEKFECSEESMLDVLKCEVIDLEEVVIDDSILDLDDKSFHAMLDRI